MQGAETAGKLQPSFFGPFLAWSYGSQQISIQRNRNCYHMCCRNEQLETNTLQCWSQKHISQTNLPCCKTVRCMCAEDKLKAIEVVCISHERLPFSACLLRPCFIQVLFRWVNYFIKYITLNVTIEAFVLQVVKSPDRVSESNQGIGK